jgi:tetrahydromethanopterin S-methyltransferase subunit C
MGRSMLRPYSNRLVANSLKGFGMPSNAHLESIGMIVEVAGVASAVAGVVLSLHHWPAAAALIGGGVAYIIGKTLREM